MRWLVFAVLAIVGVTLQTTLAPQFAVGGIWPDWLLVIAIYFALYTPSWDALVAAWALGALADMQTVERFGVLSLGYLAGAALVYMVREAVFRAHPLTQFVLTAMAAIVVHGCICAYYAATGGWGDVSTWSTFARAGLIALYTAVWAPLIHGALLRLGPAVGLAAPRRGPMGQPL
jgi:rod shape-determining protein MreD